MGIFPDAQGQLTPQSLVRSGQISNSSEMLWMSLLSASMKKIRSKIEELECSQDFSHYNPMGGYLLPWKPEFQSDLAQNLMQPFPHPNDALLKFDCDRHTGCGDIHVWKCGRTDGRTPARVPSYKLTLWASGSGELKAGKIWNWYSNDKKWRFLHKIICCGDL